MDAAAIVIALASLAFFVHGWHVRAQAELDQHIADALNNAHDRPDYEANINARWQS
jgi:hypothetical protein